MRESSATSLFTYHGSNCFDLTQLQFTKSGDVLVGTATLCDHLQCATRVSILFRFHGKVELAAHPDLVPIWQLALSTEAGEMQTYLVTSNGALVDSMNVVRPKLGTNLLYQRIRNRWHASSLFKITGRDARALNNLFQLNPQRIQKGLVLIEWPSTELISKILEPPCRGNQHPLQPPAASAADTGSSPSAPSTPSTPSSPTSISTLSNNSPTRTTSSGQKTREMESRSPLTITNGSSPAVVFESRPQQQQQQQQPAVALPLLAVAPAARSSGCCTSADETTGGSLPSFSQFVSTLHLGEARPFRHGIRFGSFPHHF